MLNYSALRNIEQKEKTTSTLTQIDADFYRQALEHIQKLEERLHEEKMKNPAAKTLILLAEELRNTKRLWESIFERREKKIVLAALSVARGGRARPEHLTREEKLFYESLIALLHEHRKRTLESTAQESQVVRIVKDIPQFVAGDMKTYDLKKEDVISLPGEVAQILIQRKVAEKLMVTV